MLFLVVPYVYCASFHRYQQVQERCSRTAQVEHILNHSDGGQDTELWTKLESDRYGFYGPITIADIRGGAITDSQYATDIVSF